MKKILIVDNSVVIINLLRDLFAKKNEFKLISAKNLDEAKELINNNIIFAAITNIVLPDALNGEILKVLKDNNIPSIVLSSNIDDNLIRLVRESYVVDYISKNSINELEYVYKLVKLLTFIDGEEVLVVDDSNVVISKVRHLLETLLLKVHTANNAEGALSILENNNNISMIITDYYMDEVNGLDFVKKIRKNEIYSKLPIMIMSSQNDDNLKIKFFKNGVTDFMTKPILDEELKSKVINIFSNKMYIQDIKKFNKIVDENVITSSTDENGLIRRASKAFCAISGYTEEELLGKNHRILRHPDMPKSLYEDLWKTITSGNQWTGEIKNLRKDGKYYWVKVVIKPDFDNNGNINGYTSVRQDITDRKRIYELSITDALTSLYNRRHFNDISCSFLENTLRENKVFSFILLDIDNFKKYNDTYGHQSGDEVLRKIGKSLSDTFKRNDDIVFRLGGEEFGIILCTKVREDVVTLAEKARNDIENLNIEHKLNLPYKKITASFGLTILDKNENIDDLNMDSIYKMSDYYLYKAKDSGRNTIKFKD